MVDGILDRRYLARGYQWCVWVRKYVSADANDSSDCFLKKVQKLLVEGVHCNLRDALDLAGKIPFSIKMLSLNVSYKKLLIDFSQASAEAIYKQSLLQFFGKKNVLPLIFLLF